MWLGKLTLDPISGAIVGGELERLEQVMFATDWAEAKAATGREPTLWEATPRRSPPGGSVHQFGHCAHKNHLLIAPGAAASGDPDDGRQLFGAFTSWSERRCLRPMY
jgi:hypothetical protein